MKKTVSGIMFLMLLTGTLTLAFNIQPVKAKGIIYIRPDGSVDPPTAPIQRDGDVYTFTDNINDSIVVERSNIIIDGNGYTLQASVSGTGFYLSDINNVIIQNTNIKDCMYGIYLWHSPNSSIISNNISNGNRDGIRLFYSPNTYIADNNINSNNGNGIMLSVSSNIEISDNKFINNGIFLGSDVSDEKLSYFNTHVIERNTINGRPIYYYKNTNGISVPEDAGSVILANCDNVTVENINASFGSVGIELAHTENSKISINEVSNNLRGIFLLHSSYNNISNNNAENNVVGIYPYRSSNNNISSNDFSNSHVGIRLGNHASSNNIMDNRVSNNTYGIYISDSSNNNKIYYNNFVDNSQQVYSSSSENVWDDGYPSGGNYWSDYTDVDVYNGPYQNETGSDGIWDHPYVIDADNQDRYPLTNPWRTRIDSPWPMFQHDPQHTGRSPYIGPGVPNLKWSFTTGEAILHASPVIGSDGTIYVGSDDGKLYAINPDGRLKWSFDAKGPIRTSPALAGDGTIYVGADCMVRGRFYALNPNGSLKWEITIDYHDYGQIGLSSPTIGDDGTIYIGSFGWNRHFWAIDPNGTKKWALGGSWGGGPGGPSSSPAIDLEGTIYVGSAGYTFRELYALNPNGSIEWKFSTGSGVVSSPSIAPDGTIYVHSYDGNLYAINPDGSLKWSFPIENLYMASFSIASDGTIYVGGSQDGKLYAINPDGSLKWNFTTKDVIYFAPVIDAIGTIYVGSGDRNFYAINPDGSLKWNFTTGGSIASPSAIGSDGIIYVGSIDGKLYAFGPTPPTPDFSMTASPTSLTIQQGNSDTSIITITSINDFDQPVQLNVSGVPSGVTTTLSPEQVTPAPDGSTTSTLTVLVATTATPGSYTLTVTGTSGALTHSTYISLEITAAPPPPNQPPDPPNFLLQYELDGPEIPVGGTISGDAVTLLGAAIDPDGDQVKIQIELRRLDEYAGSFIGVPTHESDFVDSDMVVLINITGLVLGSYHWEARTVDEPGATSDWVSFPEPLYLPNPESAADFIVKVRIEIEKQGLFGLNIGLTNEGSEEYTVTFEILDGDDKILKVRNHIEILLFKISEKSFDLPPHEKAEVYIVFDPLNKEDLEALEHAKLKFEIVYLNEKVVIENFVGHHFRGYKDIVATDFDMTEDAYSFSNTELPPPYKCYGMAISCMKYFRSDVVTYDLDKDEAMGDIDFFQRLDGVNYIFGFLLGNRLLKDYNELKKLIKEGELVLFVLVAEEEGEKIMHVVVAYKIIESESKAHIFVYDPNYPYYPSHPYPAFCNITYDFDSKEFSYEDYSRIVWVKPYNFVDVMKCGILKSVGELRFYDSQDRVTGVVNGEIRQEIPLSVYVEENDTVMIFYPSDTYRYEVVGIDQGTYGLEISSVGYGNTTIFAAIDIPTSPNATHQFTVDWVALSLGEEGVTVQVDAEGDGVFEHTFTSDSELTQSEFLAQMAFYTFSIVWGEETFMVTVESNSTVSNFAFNQPDKKISFNVTGEADTIGFCNVTIPKALLYGEPWTVLIDGAPVPPTITENATHSCLYFTYTHSTHRIQIIGTWVIPPPPPPLSVSINPLSASILVGESVTFTSTVTGGVTPYSYQWYLNGNPVSGATSSSWTFTPSTSGIYYVHLKVTDAKGNTTQSDTARITVAAVPVGGYSIPIRGYITTKPLVPYLMLLAILISSFTMVRRKIRRRTKRQ